MEERDGPIRIAPRKRAAKFASRPYTGNPLLDLQAQTGQEVSCPIHQVVSSPKAAAVLTQKHGSAHGFRAFFKGDPSVEVAEDPGRSRSAGTRQPFEGRGGTHRGAGAWCLLPWAREEHGAGPW